MPSSATCRFLVAAPALFSAALLACDDAPTTDREASGWALEEELRLTRTPEQEFGEVSAVAADADDNIYVLDSFAQQVYAFDSEGTYSHSIGREGEGPGEMSNAFAIGVGPDNRIWVPDLRPSRISLFERDGTFLAAIPRHGYPGTGTWDRPVDADGNYTDWAIRFPGEEAGGTIAEVHRRPVVHRWDGEAGEAVVADSFPPLEYVNEMAQIGGTESPRVFFAGRTLSALDGQGAFWFVHSRDYRVYRRSLEGDTLMVVAFDAEPAPVAEADVQAVRDYYARRPSRFAEDYLNALPAEKPVVVAIFADGGGNLFVLPETSDVKGGTVVDAFGPDGTYWGRAELPQPVEAEVLDAIEAYATNRYLLLAGIDDSGVPYVVRLGIRRTDGGQYTGLRPTCDGVPCANDGECGSKCTCEGFTADQLGECRAK